MRVKKKIVRTMPNEARAALSSDLHPKLKEIYLARGVGSDDELSRELSDLLPFSTLKNIDQSATLLADCLAEQKKILIVGDFDADGATSCAVAVRILKAFGAEHVDFLVPNRFEYGYGLSEALVAHAKTLAPDIIVTVDNGIANVAGVAAAKAAGITVLVTDHHLAPDVLPNADVIINPNQPGDQFPSKNLAGVGVIFYVMMALRAELRARAWFESQSIKEPNLSSFLDIVALGTVADVVPLDKNNRLLVYQGLRRIQAGRAVSGIKALLEIANRQAEGVCASDLGFALGPRLNAAGRMDDMSVGIRCLLSDNMIEARQLAMELDQFNKRRKSVEESMQLQAMTYLKELNLNSKKQIPFGLCLYDERWHQGVVGILASRIKDRLHRPVIAFAKENAQTIKGSARSIPGLHIRDVLAQIDVAHPDLIHKFGGHAMAAGLSLSVDQFSLFAELFNREVKACIDENDLEGVIYSDGELTDTELGLPFATMLQAAGPWGQQFPEPLFDGFFRVVSQRVLGGRHLKLVVEPAKGSVILDAIAFNIEADQWPDDACEQVHLAYRLNVNVFQGRRSAQLLVEQIDKVPALSMLEHG